MIKRNVILIVLILSGFVLHLSLSAELTSAELGEVSVTPNVGIAGNYGTWVVTYTAGPQGIKEGGGIRVQMPDAWHAGDRNSANPLQATIPTADYYVSASSSRRGVQIKTTVEGESHQPLIKTRRKGLDGREERYVYVVRVQVIKGSLREGDTISVIYGDTSQGSRGMRAAIITTPPQPILVAIDLTGTGKWILHPNPPTITARSGPVAAIHIAGPSTTVQGEKATLHLSFVDANQNPVDGFQGGVQFEVLQGKAQLPESLHLDLQNGWTTVPFRPTSEGMIRIKASAVQRLYTAESNPMKVVKTEPERRIYWGELHSHSKYSWDGVGSDNFNYARYVSALDFYAMTDHSIPPSDGYTHGLSDKVWKEYNALIDRYYKPGIFVTIHAYEASFGAPYGHHNVFFRGKPGPLLAPANVTLPELWKALTAGEALTIPHHTGKFPRPVLWDPDNPEFRRNIEIYSAHGLSEYYNPGHPLSFEHSKFTSPSTSAPGPQFAQDAWIHGLELSTIASSDDHRAQPGKPSWGRTAVRATGLTREEIFDALYQRRTYGTTGAKIWLSFQINGHPMGQRFTVESRPLLELEVHGSNDIEWVEVLRYTKATGAFQVLYTIRPGGPDFEWNRIDGTFREDSVYYVRLKQAGYIGNRIAMAWSSPIWVIKQP